MKEQPREIEFDSILNFRDLGGYATTSGRRVARGRIFRSGELYYATARDIARLKNEINLKSVLDLRIKTGITFVGVNPAIESSFEYRNVPLAAATTEATRENIESLHSLANVAEVYLGNIRQPVYGKAVVQALEALANPTHHPIVFHCSAGKDRTGVLAATLLSILGVADDDIVEDYALTARHMKRHLERMSLEPAMSRFLQSLPAYMHEAAPETMMLFLSQIRQEYGSAKGYVEAQGADRSLFGRLEEALLA